VAQQLQRKVAEAQGVLGHSPKYAELQNQIKKASGKRPATPQETWTRVGLYAAKVRGYGRKRAAMSDASAMAEVLLHDVPDHLIKQGAGLDPLTDMDPRLIAFALQSEGGGQMIAQINDRQHSRAIGEKVAAGDMEAYRDVLRRGTALHRAIVKTSSAVFSVVEKYQTKAGLPPMEFTVKLASERIKPKDLVTRQFAAVVNDRVLRKSAKVGDRPRLSVPQAMSVLQKVAGLNPDLRTKIGRRILADQPELRKVANIMAFDKAGAAAIVNNDSDNLARCLLGMAWRAAWAQMHTNSQ